MAPNVSDQTRSGGLTHRLNVNLLPSDSSHLTPKTATFRSYTSHLCHSSMELRGIHVVILSDDEELKEYSTKVSPDGKKATCWIPSQSGKVRKSWIV